MGEDGVSGPNAIPTNTNSRRDRISATAAKCFGVSWGSTFGGYGVVGGIRT